MLRRKKIPTDAQILRCIYDMYRSQYPAAGEIFVPIDLPAVASKLGEPAELIYGRLYFDMGTRLRHLDPKNPNLIRASIYEKVVGTQRNVVNFPYLTANLAALESDERRTLWTRGLAIAALCVSVVSFVVAVSKSDVVKAKGTSPGTKPSAASPLPAPSAPAVPASRP